MAETLWNVQKQQTCTWWEATRTQRGCINNKIEDVIVTTNTTKYENKLEVNFDVETMKNTEEIKIENKKRITRTKGSVSSFSSFISPPREHDYVVLLCNCRPSRFFYKEEERKK